MEEINLLREIYQYRPETGEFTNKTTRSSRAITGQLAGYRRKDGYLMLRVPGKKAQIYAHRVAWAFVHDKWPDKEIDHINGDPSDNRIVNLREANSQQQKQNIRKRSDNTTGHRGVHFCQRTKKFVASISRNGKAIHLGRFKEAEEASKAYLLARKELFSYQPTPREV